MICTDDGTLQRYNAGLLLWVTKQHETSIEIIVISFDLKWCVCLFFFFSSIVFTFGYALVSQAICTRTTHCECGTPILFGRARRKRGRFQSLFTSTSNDISFRKWFVSKWPFLFISIASICCGCGCGCRRWFFSLSFFFVHQLNQNEAMKWIRWIFVHTYR